MEGVEEVQQQGTSVCTGGRVAEGPEWYAHHAPGADEVIARESEGGANNAGTVIRR